METTHAAVRNSQGTLRASPDSECGVDGIIRPRRRRWRSGGTGRRANRRRGGADVFAGSWKQFRRSSFVDVLWTALLGRLQAWRGRKGRGQRPHVARDAVDQFPAHDPSDVRCMYTGGRVFSASTPAVHAHLFSCGLSSSVFEKPSTRQSKTPEKSCSETGFLFPPKREKGAVIRAFSPSNVPTAHRLSLAPWRSIGNVWTKRIRSALLPPTRSARGEGAGNWRDKGRGKSSDNPRVFPQ